MAIAGPNLELRFLLVPRNKDGSYGHPLMAPLGMQLADAENVAQQILLSSGVTITVFQAQSTWVPPAPLTVTSTTANITKNSHNQS